MTIPDTQIISVIVDESFIFRSLDDEVRDHLKLSAVTRKYNAGDVLIREDEKGGEMMIVVSGAVEVSQLSHKGEVALAVLKHRAVIGEVAVITGTPRTSTVTAKENVTVLCFSSQVIDAIVAKFPKVKQILLKLIEGRAKQSIATADLGKYKQIF